MIQIRNLNELLMSIGIASATLPEGNVIRAVVGTLSASDPEIGDCQTFALVPGPRRQ